MPENDLYLLAINLTRRCNLACVHCYMDADTRGKIDPNELTTAEVCQLLDQVSSQHKEAMVVLTGGEPLLRQDLEKIVEHGSRSGLAMVVGTNGMMLSASRVLSLKQAGVLGVGISVDSLDSHKHDQFRGMDGSWQATLSGIQACRQHKLSFQIHFTVTEGNIDELPVVIDFCKNKGARVLNVFFLVCTGRAESLTDISAEHYEEVLKYLVTAQADHPELIIRPRCAPHFKRLAYENNPVAATGRIAGSDGDGCIAGTHYCRVKPDGEVTPCPYIEQAIGSIREASFLEIWENSPTLSQLRTPSLTGKCGICEYGKLCGGCRARPVALGRGLMDEDEGCRYQPQGGAMIEPLSIDMDMPVRWHQDAEKRLDRIPGFIRKMVRQKAEVYVKQLNQSVVTCAHLDELTAKRFGGNPPFRQSGQKHE